MNDLSAPDLVRPIKESFAVKKIRNVDVQWVGFHKIVKPKQTEDDKEKSVEFEVKELSPIILDDSFGSFLNDQFRKLCGKGNHFHFKDDDKAKEPRQSLEKLLTETDPDFCHEQSIKITRKFNDEHKTRKAKNGIFLIAKMKVTSDQFPNVLPLVFLIKIDDNNVLQYKEEETEDGKKRTRTTPIKLNISDNLQAIQKMAIIDQSDTFAWDVLAYERNSPTVYFRDFLQVKIDPEHGKMMTGELDKIMRSFARECYKIEGVKDSESLRKIPYLKKYRNFERTQKNFNTEDLLRVVTEEIPNENDKNIVRNNLENRLVSHGVAGQTFEMDQSVFYDKTKALVTGSVNFRWDADAILHSVKKSGSDENISLLIFEIPRDDADKIQDIKAR
ncbi:hypothetical protein FUAX_55570 (plasmid) [Fulvitalea axinellae]|uniref:Uncharacterized protein n=1 Tax=Fulvitalea axinellae TaxID=1182444 RepID=A0AAU9DKS8_9BACT|nr:hypothetical protein FUAX_55570 [Fulvitalea axinellae]